MGFFRVEPLWNPLLELFPVDFPFPLKYVCTSSEAMKELALLPPLPLPPLTLANFLTLRLGLCEKRRHLALAWP